MRLHFIWLNALCFEKKIFAPINTWLVHSFCWKDKKMKKIFASIALALLISPVASADVIITEILDGNRIAADCTAGSSPDPFLAFVELTNFGAAPVDMSTLHINNFNNGNTTNNFGSLQLSGTLAPGDTYYVAYEGAATPPALSAFETTYGFVPNVFTGGKFYNGDDTVLLFDTAYVGGSAVDTTTVVDTYGVLGTDGSGEPWEYLDTSAFRNAGVTTGTSTFDATQWTYNPTNSADGEGCAGHLAITSVSPPSAIPEPSSLALLGLVGCAGFIRRRR